MPRKVPTSAAPMSAQSQRGRPVNGSVSVAGVWSPDADELLDGAPFFVACFSRAFSSSCGVTSEEEDGGETGVDCGYPGGPKNACKDGEACAFHDDCRSSVCYDGVCQAPNCTDAVQNGLETGIDCGGECSSPCPA